MNTEQILRNRQFYESQIFNKVAALERAKLNNVEREKLVVRREKLAELLAEMEQYQRDVKVFGEAVANEDRTFKNRRLTYIDALITDALAEIFPEEHLTAKVTHEFYRKSEAVLTLMDADGFETDPDICSGKLQQYLISFAAVSGIVCGLGISNLFIDEAFGVAAPEVLGDIGELLQQKADAGLQIVVIAQNPGLYQDLPRREIKLRKDPIQKRVKVVSITDY